MEEMTDNLDLIKIKNVCPVEDNQKNQKISFRPRENICEDMSDNGLLSKYTKNSQTQQWENKQPDYKIGQNV